MLALRLTFTSEWKPGFMEWGIISGSGSMHTKALVMARVFVSCVGKSQFRFRGGLKL